MSAPIAGAGGRRGAPAMEDVLVVGGGPVGLAMACELHRHGVRCRVVDKNEGPQVWSKAAAMTPRTLEVLEDVGVGPRLREVGRAVYGMAIHKGVERIAHITFAAEGTPFPNTLGIAQRDTELILADHLKTLGGALERPVELRSFEETADGVQATLVGPSGAEEVVHARWLVACDGARSTVRERLGLPFEGSTFEQNLIQADVKVDLPFWNDPGEAVIFLSPEGIVGALPLLAENRWRVIALDMPDPDAEATFDVFRSVVRRRVPEGVSVHDPAWVAKFRFHGRIVPSYRVGRVFLAGDAAHIHSPVGGQGMNMGIQDAYNLAWKLALVVRGRARPTLLDSYDPERRPVGRATVGVTDRATKAVMRFLSLRSPLATALRDQAVAFLMSSGLVGDRVFQRVGQLGVGYAGSPAVGEHQVSVWSGDVALARHRDRELPALSDWVDFGRGLGAGDRVPDVDLSREIDEEATLFGLLRGTRHTLLLFDGLAATSAGYENLAGIARRVAGLHGDLFRVYIVTPRAARPAELAPDLEVILDDDASLHRHFGSASESLFVVRPDGHVGFRSQPADGERLLAWLDTFLVRASA